MDAQGDFYPVTWNFHPKEENVAVNIDQWKLHKRVKTHQLDPDTCGSISQLKGLVYGKASGSANLIGWRWRCSVYLRCMMPTGLTASLFVLASNAQEMITGNFAIAAELPPIEPPVSPSFVTFFSCFCTFGPIWAWRHARGERADVPVVSMGFPFWGCRAGHGRLRGMAWVGGEKLQVPFLGLFCLPCWFACFLGIFGMEARRVFDIVEKRGEVYGYIRGGIVAVLFATSLTFDFY